MWYNFYEVIHVIKLENITKIFGKDFVAVDNISIELEEGKIYGFLGPNGAGKTTTLKMLTGVLSPDSGTITINGIELTLATNTSTTIIDCETENAYEGAINRNGDLTVNNGFPTLDLGENEISVSGCTINLIPRWWRL
jgi:ABC-type polysaccharide/polyol phosphate transport system ATPase subunit